MGLSKQIDSALFFLLSEDIKTPLHRFPMSGGFFNILSE